MTIKELIWVIQFPDGKGYPVTARTMTDNKQKRYSRSKNR